MAKKLQEVHSDKYEANISENWELARFDEISDVTDYVANGSFASLKANVKYLDKPDYAILVRLTDSVKGWNGNYKYVDKHAYDFLAKSSVNPGDVVIANVGDPGKVFIVPNLGMPMTLGPNSVLIKPKDGINNKYLAYFFHSGWGKDLISQITTGTAQKKFNKTGLRSTYIPVAPHEQQKRIVAKIEELFSHVDAGIEALKNAKQLLKQYRQSVLKAAVTGKLTEQWRADRAAELDAQGSANAAGGRKPGAATKESNKYETAQELLERILKERRQKWEEQQLEQFKAKGKMPKNDKWKEKYKDPVVTRDWAFLSEIPDSWSWVSVDQIGDSQDQPVLTGPFGSNLGKEDFTQDGVPVLTIGCLQEEGIDLSRAMHVSKKKAEELDRYQLKEGDMLFSRMAAVGRAGFVTPELSGALFNYHIMRLRLHPHAMLQEYFVHYVRGSSQVYNYVKEVNHGATRDGINTQQLLQMPVALAPLQEQEEICKVVGEKLGAIRRLESDINIQLMKAERNKQSVLTSAFLGGLI